MEANQQDHDTIRSIALVRIATALDAQAAISRASLDYQMSADKKSGRIDPKSADQIKADLTERLEESHQSMQDMLSIFTGETPTGAVARADEIINKMNEEETENQQ